MSSLTVRTAADEDETFFKGETSFLPMPGSVHRTFVSMQGDSLSITPANHVNCYTPDDPLTDRLSAMIEGSSLRQEQHKTKTLGSNGSYDTHVTFRPPGGRPYLVVLNDESTKIARWARKRDNLERELLTYLNALEKESPAATEEQIREDLSKELDTFKAHMSDAPENWVHQVALHPLCLRDFLQQIKCVRYGDNSEPLPFRVCRKLATDLWSEKRTECHAFGHNVVCLLLADWTLQRVAYASTTRPSGLKGPGPMEVRQRRNETPIPRVLKALRDAKLVTWKL